MTSTQAKASGRAIRLPIANGLILHDSHLGEFDPDWFDPAHWRALGLCQKLGAGRGAAWRIDAAQGRWVLRHYRRGGLAARVSDDKYLWLGEARSRSVAEFVLLDDLARRQLPVPAPVAARVRRTGPWYRADIIVKFLEGTRTMAELLKDDALGETQLRAIGRTVRRFHDEGVWHADLNAHNVLLDEQSVYLIDFDRARLRSAGNWAQDNLARLRRSLNKLSVPAKGKVFPDGDWDQLMQAWQAGR